MPPGTTLRNVRVAEELWTRALAVAQERDETLSDVIRIALEWYAEEPGKFMHRR